MKFLQLLFFCIILFIAACKSEKQSDEVPVEEQTAVPEETASADTEFSVPELDEVDFDRLMHLQEQISTQPDDAELRRLFLEEAYFRNKNALVTIGVGRLHHPESGRPISRGLVQRAARLDASRWATYGYSWLKHDLSPDFGKLDTTFRGMQTVLMTYDRGDSLYLAVASDMR